MSEDTMTCRRGCPVDRAAAGRCLTAVAGVVLSLIDLRHLSKGQRRLYWLATAGATAGAAVAWNADESLSNDERLVVAGVAAGATLLTAPIVGRLDMGVTNWLERRGLKRPRLVAAALTAATIGATVWAERTSRAEAPTAA